MLMAEKKQTIADGIKADEAVKKDDDLTPTQRRIMNVLRDGQEHQRAELEKLLNDDMAVAGALGYHIAMIRRKLLARHEDIVYRFGRGYRYVRAMMPGLPKS